MVDAYLTSDPREINAGLMMGLMWLNNMDIYYQLIDAGYPILPVRYEDLKAKLIISFQEYLRCK